MVEPIDKTKKSSSSSKKPLPIQEEEEERGRAGSEPVRPTYLLTPSQGHIAACSPSELSPADDSVSPQRGGRNTDPAQPSAKPDHSKFRAKTHDPKKTEYFPPMPIALGASEDEAEHQQALGGSSRPVEVDGDGIARKDTVLTMEEKEEREEVEDSPEGMGLPFRIQWIKVGSLAFGRTRLLRNPWNADREVKVSRDGTEVEPSEWICGIADDRRRIAAHGGMGEPGVGDFLYLEYLYTIICCHRDEYTLINKLPVDCVLCPLHYARVRSKGLGHWHVPHRMCQQLIVGQSVALLREGPNIRTRNVSRGA
jgi:hypothetical protein